MDGPEHGEIVVAAPTMDMVTNIVHGSRWMLCADCGTTVLVGPKAQRMVYRKSKEGMSSRIVCFDELDKYTSSLPPEIIS